MLNNHFCSEFTKEDLRIPKLVSSFSPAMPEINIDIGGVRSLMKHLDPLQANGPDKVQPRFLELMAKEIPARITLIFRVSHH